MMPQLKTNIACDISYHAFGPALQLLRVKEPWNQAVAAQMGGFGRQVDRWGSSSLSIGFLGPLGRVTLSEEEGRKVYGALDAVFVEVFPDLAGMTRLEAAAFIQEMVDDVRFVLVEKFPNGPNQQEILFPAYQQYLETCEFLRSFLGKGQLRLEDLEFSSDPS